MFSGSFGRWLLQWTNKLILLLYTLRCLIDRRFCFFFADNVFCFYGSWAVYRPGSARFGPEDIDVNRCTHVTYSFVGLRDDGQVNVLDAWADEQLSEYLN